jgi:cobalt-zinc-cadmium efflux system outer membrane protein
LILPWRLVLRKTPGIGRSFAALMILVASCRSLRAETITERRVIGIARTRDPSALAAHLASSVAEAEQIRAGVYPNPSVSWQRERVTGREQNDSILLTVPVDVSGRREAQSALARSSASTARARAARTQSEAVSASLDAFYAALAAERELEIARRAVARLDEAARVVRRRYEEGTTSGYERTRLEVEVELERSQLRQSEARVTSARATLAVLLGADPRTMELRGDFRTGDPRSSAAAARREPRSITWIRAAQSDARDAVGAARWAWVPTLSLSGGLRVSEWPDTQYGYVAGVSLTLPVFSRGQELRAESAARQQLAAAEVRAAERSTRLEEVRAREVLAAARQEIVRFAEATRARVELLERAVQSGYREGDRSVVELVDAERVRADVDRRQLALELVAKRAEIDLRAARGEFE